MLREFYRIAAPGDAVSKAIAYASEQPGDVEIDEVVVRPTVHDFDWFEPQRRKWDGVSVRKAVAVFQTAYAPPDVPAQPSKLELGFAR
jgi:hypothetical protein